MNGNIVFLSAILGLLAAILAPNCKGIWPEAHIVLWVVALIGLFPMFLALLAA